ncbi:MAG: response regulator, partial [Coraliomargarita sp.]
GVLLLDRSLELAYAPSVDPDLLEPLPDSMARILISELIPPSTVKSAVVLSYPLSRYKLLSTVLSLLDLRLPDYLFRKYDESDFDNIDLSGLRVLVAEDNTINQKVARMTIERFGATVDLAANGQEVLGLVDRFGYDLILMDIRMPVMNGVESCKRLRSKGIHTPIYALTADAMKGDRERFLEAGMNGYLSKPLVEADLAELLVNYRINAQEPLEDEVTDSGSVGSGSADELYGQAPDLLILDLDAFIELLDGSRSVALNLLQQFAASVDQAIFEAEAALANGDFETACSRFHQLAGTSATICAHQARAFFLSLECSLMEDPPNAELCVKRFPEAREALQRLCAEIRIADEQG